MRQELQDLKMHIYEDGTISAAEIKMLKGLFALGFGEDEATLLLDLNTVLSDEDHAEGWKPLFIDHLTAFSIGADGAVDGAKWDWLKANLLKDQVIDTLELDLLCTIKERAKSVPSELLDMVSKG